MGQDAFFSSAENLAGGSLNDLFTLNNGVSVSGTVNGGGATE
jgi:hypothetical protein